MANRFYYQANIPRKDAAILSQLPGPRGTPPLDPPHHRPRRHDRGEGGIEAWLRLGEAVGLTREEIEDERHLLPGVRFAVDAYVTFARTRPWVEAVASSLTELFAPDLMAERLAAFERYYPWIDPRGPRLLPVSPRAGTPRLRTRSRGGHASTASPRDAGARHSPRCRSSATCCGACSTPSTRPTRRRIDDSARPRLAPHVRMRFDAARGQHALLSPRRSWVLNGTGAAIVELCDGRRTVAEIQCRAAEPVRAGPRRRGPPLPRRSRRPALAWR